MPSGLDHSAPDSASHRLAHTLYTELMGWSAGIAQVVVMGDLNEILTRWDRLPMPPAPSGLAAAAGLASPLAALQQDGFTDVYRHLHPPPELSPGFTHVIEGLRPSRSRLDYIWSKGWSASDILSSQVDPALCALSHHRLLWAEMRLSHAPPSPCTTPLLQMRLPNMRAATEVHKSKLQRTWSAVCCSARQSCSPSPS